MTTSTLFISSVYPHFSEAQRNIASRLFDGDPPSDNHVSFLMRYESLNNYKELPARDRPSTQSLKEDCLNGLPYLRKTVYAASRSVSDIDLPEAGFKWIEASVAEIIDSHFRWINEDPEIGKELIILFGMLYSEDTRQWKVVFSCSGSMSFGSFVARVFAVEPVKQLASINMKETISDRIVDVGAKLLTASSYKSMDAVEILANKFTGTGDEVSFCFQTDDDLEYFHDLRSRTTGNRITSGLEMNLVSLFCSELGQIMAANLVLRGVEDSDSEFVRLGYTSPNFPSFPFHFTNYHPDDETPVLKVYAVARFTGKDKKEVSLYFTIINIASEASLQVQHLVTIEGV